MNGTLTISGDLALLGKLALKIDDWFPNAFATAVNVPAFGQWDVETMTILLRRLAKKQLDLIDFVSSNDGYRSDDEVRAQFGNDGGGMKGLTGPISKHIKAMVASGMLQADPSFVVKTEPNPVNRNLAGGFLMPRQLVPVVRAAIDSL